MNKDFTTEQTLPVSFKIVDGRGRPANVENGPKAASSDETVVTVGDISKEGDVWKFDINSVAEGQYRVTVTADANLDPNEVNEIVGIIEGSVTHDARTDARTIELVAGDPIDD